MFLEKRVLSFLAFLSGDVACIGLLLLTGSLVNCLVTPRSFAFLCNDASFNFKFLSHSVPLWALLAGSLLIPIGICILLECIFYWQLQRKRHLATEFYSLEVGPVRVPSVVNRGCFAVAQFVVGWAVVFCAVAVAKVVTGRPRPHYFTVCEPDCDRDSPKAPYQFTGNVTCKSRVQQSKCDSFPSGHAALAMYAATFSVIYMHFRLHWHRMRFLGTLLQALLLICAVSCALTAWTDRQNHSEDIVVGGILGVVVAYFQVVHVWGLNETYERVEKLKHEDGSLHSYDVEHVYADSGESSNMVVLKRTTPMTEDGQTLPSSILGGAGGLADDELAAVEDEMVEEVEIREVHPVVIPD